MQLLIFPGAKTTSYFQRAAYPAAREDGCLNLLLAADECHQDGGEEIFQICQDAGPARIATYGGPSMEGL